MSSEDDKERRLNRGTLIRRLILGFFPIISLLFRNWLAFAVVSGVSVLAIALDKTRNQRRAMPFLLFLLVVWLIQAMSLSLVLNLDPSSSTEWVQSLNLEHPDVAMRKWAAVDEARQVQLLDEDWPEAKFPWIKEFPVLNPDDAKPEIKTASVILAAHNEQEYLERTIESIFNVSDPDQLAEILIVDDASEPPLQGILDEMPSNPKVKLIRNSERQGLIRSKSTGADKAIGDLIIFLDAHVKPETDWLLPLFKHTNENWKRVVVPVIPILKGDTWTVESTAVGYKMMFDWGLGFSWFDDGNDWVPIMSGGLLAITRRYWHWSGAYDTGMLQWGGENIEQSIRIWLCGGEIVVARNSRVSHVFRPNFPYAINHTQVSVNKVRLVEVWFDEYKEFYYKADPFARTLVKNKGDVAERLELQKKLHCKPFQYFVDRFRSVFDKRNMLPKKHFAIKDQTSRKCIEGKKDGTLTLSDCAMAVGENYRSSHRFIPGPPGPSAQPGHFSSISHLLRSESCFDANGSVTEKIGANILLYPCKSNNAQQSDWAIDQGGIRWKDFCGYIGNDNVLKFGACTQEEAGFLGKKFYGHENHRFEVVDERGMAGEIPTPSLS